MSGRRNGVVGRSSRGERRTNDLSSQPVPSTSRRAQSQRFSSQNVRSSQNDSQVDDNVEVEERANAAVIFALSLAQSGKSFKKADLLQGCKLKSRSASEHIISSAQRKLENVYGLKLAEIFPGKFIVVVPKHTPFRDEVALLSKAASRPFSSLLGVVLALIYFRKGRVSEDDLKNMMLPKLFPDITMSPHPYFGNVDKLLQEFEHQVFIIKETESRGGEQQVFYKWGPRAELEFDKKALVIPVLMAIFGGNVPRSLLEELEKEADHNTSANSED